MVLVDENGSSCAGRRDEGKLIMDDRNWASPRTAPSSVPEYQRDPMSVTLALGGTAGVVMCASHQEGR